MTQMEQMLAGLTRGVDLGILDTGFGTVDGHALSFYPKGSSLGVVLPSNSPGVHALWIPSFALKIPLVLKPGSAEPWSPYRIIQALIKAGASKGSVRILSDRPRRRRRYPAKYGTRNGIW